MSGLVIWISIMLVVYYTCNEQVKIISPESVLGESVLGESKS